MNRDNYYNPDNYEGGQEEGGWEQPSSPQKPGGYPSPRRPVPPTGNGEGRQTYFRPRRQVPPASFGESPGAYQPRGGRPPYSDDFQPEANEDFDNMQPQDNGYPPAGGGRQAYYQPTPVDNDFDYEEDESEAQWNREGANFSQFGAVDSSYAKKKSKGGAGKQEQKQKPTPPQPPKQNRPQPPQRPQPPSGGGYQQQGGGGYQQRGGGYQQQGGGGYQQRGGGYQQRGGGYQQQGGGGYQQRGGGYQQQGGGYQQRGGGYQQQGGGGYQQQDNRGRKQPQGRNQGYGPGHQSQKSHPTKPVSFEQEPPTRYARNYDTPQYERGFSAKGKGKKRPKFMPQPVIKGKGYNKGKQRKGPLSISIISLPRALARYQFASRKVAVEHIKNGRVYVNNNIVTDPNMRITYRRDKIRVDLLPMELNREKTYVVINKPEDVSGSKETATLSVHSYVQHSESWYCPAGRLDKPCSGLVFLTNDPEHKSHDTTTFNELEKEYHIKVHKLPAPHLFEEISNRLKKLHPLNKSAASISVKEQNARHAWVRVIVKRARLSDIRSLLKEYGCEVLSFVRYRVGGITTDLVESGTWRQMSELELALLFGKQMPTASFFFKPAQDLDIFKAESIEEETLLSGTLEEETEDAE